MFVLNLKMYSQKQLTIPTQIKKSENHKPMYKREGSR